MFTKKNLYVTLLAGASVSAHSELMITAVFDGPLPGGLPKGIELFVTEDIADLSAYGVGSANNGSGSDGQEFTFPAVSAKAGDVIYVASEDVQFTDFFGFAPTYTSGAMSINGDDAIEVFFNGNVSDLFGDINVDGNGEAWEYLDGWAARATSFGPSTTFNIADWTFSSPDALDGETTNASAATPVPVITSGGDNGGSTPSDESPLMITAVFDGPITGGVPKGVEVLVREDIADLSIFGLGSANNGNGSNGEEFTFPSVAAAAGDYLYIASEDVEFANFFGFAPDYTSNAMAINGDDAIELFMNGEVVDLFGDINVDGNGEAWEYLDGWAARNDGSTPSATFNAADWTFSGPNALDGETTNATAANPVPVSESATPLIISAVFDGPLPGGLPKGIEIRVLANIDDLSTFGVGSANNGNGSAGVEFTFPADSAQAGDVIYVASEEAQFNAFFGFAPNYTSSAVNINGDDAIELFMNDEVIDLFGDINVDGTGQPWEYLDGWAARNASASPSAVFNIAEWTFSGTNALDGETSNDTASTPIPVAGEGDNGGGSEPVEVQLISAIQGNPDTYAADNASPLLNQTVAVEAVVVGDFQDNDEDESRDLRGFYLQEEASDEDGNPLSSEGIFVFDVDFGVDVNLGDVVRVEGTVSEFFNQTQIGNVTKVEVLQAGTEESLALVNNAMVDLSSITDVTLSQSGFYQPELEAYEGMLITITNELQIVEQFQLDRFNEIRLAAGERLVQFTQTNLPDVDGYQAHLKEIGARTITYDDGLSVQTTSIDNLDGFAIYDEASAPRMGDTTQNLTGVLTYQWAGHRDSGATWRVRSHLDGTNYFTSTLNGDSPNPRPLTPPEVEGTLKVASFNVLNYFKTLDAPNVQTAAGHRPRGADDLTRFGVEPATFEVERQTAKLVNTITAIQADIFGLVELENEFDSTNDGSTAIEVLVNAINAELGSDTYDYVYPGSQFVGTDAIAVGFIYNTNTVVLTEGSNVALLDDSVAATLAPFASHDFDADPIFNGTATNRVSLAATFTHLESEKSVTVVSNHFKSKGSSRLSDTSSPNFDQGDGAGFWNDRRNNASIAVTAWLKTNPTGIEEDKAILLGDFNAYAQEDPIQTLISEGFINVEDSETYSYVFSGQVGTLDYGFISDTLMDAFTGAAVWHINADEADAVDYNADFGRDQSYYDGETATRNSDHDPLIFGLNLVAEQASITDLIEAFEAGVENGAIKGTSRFPHWNEYFFKRILLVADYFVQHEKSHAACKMLNKAILKSDGERFPRDLITGTGIADFNALVTEVNDELGCERPQRPKPKRIFWFWYW